MTRLDGLRSQIRAAHCGDEAKLLAAIEKAAGISAPLRARIHARATRLVEDLRAAGRPGVMEAFLAEYGLSTEEGIALMCLAEALMRVPDTKTIDELIEDKIAPSSWSAHLGHSTSPLVNASTWALLLTGAVLKEEGEAPASILRGALKRLGEPVIRSAVKRAMRELGNQFVLGQTIGEAIKRSRPAMAKGYRFSYDMLGEAALTAADADRYYQAYADAIATLARDAGARDIDDNPSISIKLSALHPRYEQGQRARVLAELPERIGDLARLCRAAHMGLSIDAEEADRLDLSLDVIEAVLALPHLGGWNGFGVVVQAYGKRAHLVIDWLYALAVKHKTRIMVRLVKGAYWDSEIKRAQVAGVADFPVFTRKAATDISYLCAAKKLLAMRDHLYPQFATHNAYSVAAIVEMAQGSRDFEFQRLHGMGQALHEQVRTGDHGRCRIYAPVGSHKDLLAYLVRRLLENGANSSFVNQMTDLSVPVAEIAADPFERLNRMSATAIPKPPELFGPGRVNARGWNLANVEDRVEIDAARTAFATTQWQARPLIAVDIDTASPPQPVRNPADLDDQVGEVIEAAPDMVDLALGAAQDWRACPARQRAAILRRAAAFYERDFGEFFAVLAREAGKTPDDAVAELREAVDFLRYYANQAERWADRPPCGLFACISPWNFPLAIFTGQIAAALAAGNGVLAKPAESTPITASLAVKLLHEAGVPREVLQLLPGKGAVVGAKLTADPRINGVCFTGSTATARTIRLAMVEAISPTAPLIAETGGINAMIVDSTALLEQAVKDVMASAFRSAGQRCSALRVLYLQEEIAAPFLAMLSGAMDELVVGDPWAFATDLGPVIDAAARTQILRHIAAARQDGRLIKALDAPGTGHFVGPAVIRVAGIEDLDRETFGPVLHVATFRSGAIDQVIASINASFYGLTFGLHSRIDDRVEQITTGVNAGNIYVNRNQIGAVVGSQPFGGEGLSGTGPKAGGPHYVRRFTAGNLALKPVMPGPALRRDDVQRALDRLQRPGRKALSTESLPGPTGESNLLSVYPRGTVLCLGPTAADARAQADALGAIGCPTLAIAPGVTGETALSGFLDRSLLAELRGFDAVALWSDEGDLRLAARALAARPGPILPLVATTEIEEHCRLERHLCVDTTAAGGNVALLAAQA